MKKGIFIFLLLLVAIIGIAPFGIGIMLEKQNQTMMGQYKDLGITAIDTAYERGWFHSQITSTLNFTSNTGESLQFTMHQKLRHGPILWGENQPLALGFADLQSDIAFSSDIQAKLKDVIGDMPKIQLLGSIDYNGSTEGKLSIAGFTHHNSEKNIRIEFQPLILSASSNLDMDTSQGIWQWKGMRIIGEHTQAQIAENISHFNIQKKAGIWTGHMDWQTDNMALTSPQQHMHIKGIRLEAQTHLDDQQRVSSEESLHIDSIQHHNKLFTSADIQIAIRHIPAASLNKLKAMQQKAVQTQNPYAVGMNMLGLLPEIIASEPEIEISHASVHTPDGAINANLHMTVLGLKKNDIFNFPKVKKHIQADMFVHFPMALITEKNRAQIMDWIQRGWLVQHDDILEGRLHMSDGILTINQQHIALPF